MYVTTREQPSVWRRVGVGEAISTQCGYVHFGTVRMYKFEVL